jgi:hypothetical protein
MFGFGLGETILIAIIALVAIGPKQLPEVARTIGRFINEMRRASGEIGRNIDWNPAKAIMRPESPPVAAPPVAAPIATPTASAAATVSPVVSDAPTVAAAPIVAATPPSADHQQLQFDIDTSHSAHGANDS